MNAQLAIEFDRFEAAVIAQRAIRVCDPHVDPAQKPRLTGQNAAVLERLKRGPLSTVEAVRDMGVLRLAARIYDIRDAGYQIGRDLDANGVATYTLVSEEA